MGTLVSVTVEEYLSTAYDPDCDYVGGMLEDRNVGEKDHNKLQGNLYLYLRQNYPHLFACLEQRLRIAPDRYRIPDLCVYAAEPEEQVFTTPPLLCVEILSPEDRMGRMQRKIDDYLEFGAACVWVIDPQRRTAEVHTLQGSCRVRDGVIRSAELELAVPLDRLFG